ncbi:hypothetical protein OUZ56_032573 [Daphnia magna]|uniref:Uncharacterized protein n=1 Tax=Daphnia magna TaxID=35525 RepID=A0ABR0B9N9_9CRUS|nr:hypothetical protein OUZ56_032573 [Daphnia magna]
MSEFHQNGQKHTHRSRVTLQNAEACSRARRARWDFACGGGEPRFPGAEFVALCGLPDLKVEEFLDGWIDGEERCERYNPDILGGHVRPGAGKDLPLIDLPTGLREQRPLSRSLRTNQSSFGPFGSQACSGIIVPAMIGKIIERLSHDPGAKGGDIYPTVGLGVDAVGPVFAERDQVGVLAEPSTANSDVGRELRRIDSRVEAVVVERIKRSEAKGKGLIERRHIDPRCDEVAK